MNMCTAIRFNERYFGRTLDFERSFGESLVVTPREKMRLLDSHNRYAMMGVGVLEGGVPMYFDGVNEWGLAAAALNFPKYAQYRSEDGVGRGIFAGHLISHVLGLCRSVSEARQMLQKTLITGRVENKELPATPLHWIIADGRESAVIESVESGLKIYDNPVGVLTNSPELPYHLTRLDDFSYLRAENPEGGLYSRGLGAVGMPGDYSSTSRFIRAAFLKKQSFGETCSAAVGDMHRAFSLLDAVSVPLGAVITDEGLPAFTIYSAVIDLAEPSYYLTTASCRTIHAISLTDSLLDGREIQSYPIYREEKFISLTN